MSLTVTNHGTVNGPISFRINGPVDGPTLTQAVGEQTRSVALPGLNLGESDHLIIGSIEQPRAMLNGTQRADRHLTSRQWMTLVPGDNRFTLTDKSGADLSAQIVVTANSAW